jgi:hypothetical protein
MNLAILYDFMQVLNSIRKQPTKNDYFTKHIIFTIIYLLQDQKLNHENYSRQKRNTSNFV